MTKVAKVYEMVEKNMLSAFFDGENDAKNADKDQWLDSLGEPDNLQAWKSYNLTREILRDQAVQTVNWDISAQVAKALEQESCHQGEKISANNRIVQLKSSQPTPEQAKRTLPAWLQQFAQMGSAAAVAIVVILGVQEYNEADNIAQAPLSQQPPVLQTIPISGGATPVSLTRDISTNVDDAQRIQQQTRVSELFQDFELQSRLNALNLDKANE